MPSEAHVKTPSPSSRRLIYSTSYWPILFYTSQLLQRHLARPLVNNDVLTLIGIGANFNGDEFDLSPRTEKTTFCFENIRPTTAAEGELVGGGGVVRLRKVAASTVTVVTRALSTTFSPFSHRLQHYSKHPAGKLVVASL